MTRRPAIAIPAGIAFLACILAANYVTSRLGLVPVGFGLMATAGTYFAGLTFVLRDVLSDTAGKRWVVALIAGGAALSFAISDPAIALASAVAFGLSELADFALYQPLRRRGYIRAALVSNIVGAVVDTFVFLTLAASALRAFDRDFSIAASVPGQLVGKLMVTAVVVIAVALVRLASRRAEPTAA